jgi:hypothetical protein
MQLDQALENESRILFILEILKSCNEMLQARSSELSEPVQV